MKKLYTLTALILLAFSGKAAGISPVAVNHQSEIELYTHAQIVNVGEKILELEDIQRQKASLNFRPLVNANENLEFTADNYWVHFALHNTTSQLQTYYLETARPITDRVDLYQTDPQGKSILLSSGDQIPFSERAFPHRASIFKLHLEPGATYSYYMHLESDGEVINLPLTLHSPDHFIKTVYNQQLFYGLFYGIVVIAALIYLFFYLGLQEISFLYYSLYVITIGLLQFALDGFVFQYFLPQAGWFNARAVIFCSTLSILFLGLYSESFLGVRAHFKWLSRIFKTTYILSGVILLAAIVSPQGLEVSYPLVNQLGLVLLLTIITSIVALKIKGLSVDPFYIVGIGFLILGFVIFILNNLSLIPNNFFTENGSKIGSGLEVIFLSLSMTNRIRRLKGDKELSQSIALKKSQEMNELKSHFMSTMSHELRTPLNAIMGIADTMMKEEKLDTRIRSNFEVVKYASVSLLSSVNDILDFSKIEQGKLKLDSKNFNPGDILERISQNWKIQASDKGLFYVFKISPDVPAICKGDEARLEQIANNVLSNAIKFTPKGNVNFIVNTTSIDQDHVRIILEISDTGIGISDEKMETIFDSFIQESTADKRNFGGLGLGLSIVKKLVELHDGEIKIESQVGEGTLCKIELPYLVVQQTAKRTLKLSPEENDLGGANILVAEDNTLNQLIMRKILSSWKNVSFSIVENGQEAIKALEKNSFDLILMDLQMPVMDGYEATTYIREGHLGTGIQSIPIIAVTADTMEETKQKVIDIGMNEYLSKPIYSTTLFEMVSLLLVHDES